ncbi:MAG: ribonuclease R [Eubacteriales bacterium]|nr:ribonuclease R [Eubacteriales bacterium]
MHALPLEELVELLKNRPRAEDAQFISQKAGVRMEELEGILQEGLESAAIVRTSKGRYTTPEQAGLVVCRVTVGGSLLFGRPLDEELRRELHGDIRLDMEEESAWPDDTVLVRITEKGERARGTLVSIAKRAHETIAATLVVPPVEPERRKTARARRRPHRPRFAPEIVAVPEDSRIRDRIVIDGLPADAHNGDVVIVRLTRYPQKGVSARGFILEVIGDADDARTALKAIAASHGFSRLFSDEAAQEAGNMPENVSESDMADRRDLRGLTLFTIDGADAQDFDDAVSLEKTEDGWLLGVHIADVSHYVLPGSAIEKEAFSRTTSVYLPGMTFPMLPEALSNRLCSLMPNENRLALSCMMRMQGAKVVEYEIFPSVIRSCARLVYSDVNAMFRGEENDVPEQLQSILDDMRSLAHTIRRARENRGAIEFDLPEPDFKLDEQGEPLHVQARERWEAEMLIEDFMLTANETVAKYTREAEIPIPYRVHEPPDPDTIAELGRYLESMEVPAKVPATPAPAQLRKVLELVKGKPEESALNTAILRAMRKAEYGPMPHGHFALAARDYCHFTSPIRRYPDLTVHRVVKSYLRGECNGEWLTRWTSAMPEIASHCSHGEYAAVLAEREADDRMRARYMARHIGEKFEGVVTGATQTSLFVGLPNTAEGRIPVWTLDEPYAYVEDMRCLMGEYSRKMIRIGQKVEVRLERVEEREGYIEFRLWQLIEE